VSCSPVSAQAVGFALFIFSVGYQAGPRFFDVLRTDGFKYFLLSLVIALVGLTVVTLATKQLALEPGTSAGLLAGGLTSSPTLAAAQEAIRGGSVAPPEGWSAEAVIGNISTAYAITYIFGLAGLIAIIKFLPDLLGIDLAAQARELEGETLDGPSATRATARAYRVTNEAFTRVPLGELRERFSDGFDTGWLRRGGQLIDPAPEEFLQLGDEIQILGGIEFFSAEFQEIGEEITASRDMTGLSDAAQVIVTHRDVMGRRLAELDINRNFRVLVTEIRRMRFSVPKSMDLQLRKGDILTVVGPANNIDRLGKAMGHVERDIAETDMITFAFGIAAGVLLGLLSVTIGGISLRLGSAGGLLVSGLLVGFFRSVRPTFGRMPDAARWIFMEFGLLIFMAGVGLRAGGEIVQTFLAVGPKLVVAGILVTVTPVTAGYLFGRKALKIHPVLLLGAITGAMTSSPSLSVVTKAANSSVPALGYTGSYAFANVLLTVAGSIILLF
jgi:putative transport protein